MEQNPFDQFDAPASTSAANPFDQFDEVKESSVTRRALGDTGVSLLKGAIAVPEAAVGIADIATGGRAGKVAEGLGFRPKEAKEILNEYYSPEQKAANQKLSEAEGFVDNVKTAVQNPSTILQAGVESVPLIAGGGVVGLGARALKATPVIAGAIGEGTVGAGMAAEGIRQETDDGLLSAKQSGIAALSGLGTAAFGAAGGKLAQKLGIGDIDTIASGGASPATNKGFARKLVEGGIAEGVFEELPQSVQEQMLSNYALDKPLTEGVDKAAAMGLLTGSAMGAGVGALTGGKDKLVIDQSGLEADAALAEQKQAEYDAQQPAQPEPDEFTNFTQQVDADIEQRKIAAGIKKPAEAIPASDILGGENVSNTPNATTELANDTITGSSDNIQGSLGDLPNQLAGRSDTGPIDNSTETSTSSGTGNLPVGTSPTGDDSVDLQDIPYDSVSWNDVSSSKEYGSGVSKIIDYAGRKMVQVKVNGVNVPFYLSTGKGGKTDVTSGKWYPIFGIGSDGWLNKTSGADINNYYGSAELKAVSEKLDAMYGDIRNSTSEPKVSPTGAHISAINQGLNPTENGTNDTVANLDKNIKDVISRIESGRTATDAVEERPFASATDDILPKLRGMTTDAKVISQIDEELKLRGLANDVKANDAATSVSNDLPEPTDAQKEAGNYKKGAIKISGLNISVENPHESVRKGVDKTGTAWESKQNGHYGYIKGVVARAPDKEHVDVNIKQGTTEDYAGDVYVINQSDPSTGKFDEPKVYIGYTSQAEAKNAYHMNYAKGWAGFGGMAQLPMAKFKEMLNDKNAFMNPVKTDIAQQIEQRKADDAVQAQPDQKTSKPAAAESPDNTEARNAIETIVKRRAAANQIGKGKAFDSFLAQAKKMLAGELVPKNTFKLAKNAFKADPALAEQFGKLDAIINQSATDSRQSTKQVVEGIKAEIAAATDADVLDEIKARIVKLSVSDNAAIELDDTLMAKYDELLDSPKSKAKEIDSQFAGQGDLLSEPKPTENQDEVIHNGVRLYKIKVRNRVEGQPPTEMWAVESTENKARKARGERAIGGDNLSETLDEAKAEAELMLKREADNNQAADAQAKLEAEQKEQSRIDADKKSDIDGFGSELNAMQLGKLKETLNKQTSINGVVSPLRDAVRNLVSKGGKPEIKEENVYKGMSRAQYNRADNRAQQEDEKRIREGGKKNVYYITMPDGGMFELGKTAHDFADYLISKTDSKPQDEVAKATEALTAAGVKGKEKLDTIKDVREGKVTAEEVADAYGEPATQKPKGNVDDFGEKLEGARKDMVRAMAKEYSDDELASLPLSKIWPITDVNLIENKTAAAIAWTAREEIPSKPRKPYALKVWVGKVKILRDIGRIVSKALEVNPELMLQKLKDAQLGQFKSKVALLEAIDRDAWKRIGKVEEYPNAYSYVDGVKQIKPMVRIDVDGVTTTYEASSVADVIDNVNEKLGKEKQEKRMAFEVRGSSKGGYFINKKGDKNYTKLKTFDSSKEAFEFLRNNYDEVVAAWDATKDRLNVKESDVRGKENRPRTGEDYRKGKDVSSEEFATTFGFRGIQFGEWVKQGGKDNDRQGALNAAYDALMDLANIVGVPPKAMSLEGTLGLSFGARGKGSAAAHFEPGNLVINLTKTQGAGTLAHEWFHALDNYFSRKRGGEKSMAEVKSQQAYREGNYITYKPEALYINKNYGNKGITKAELERYRKQSPNSKYWSEENWILDPKHPQGVRPEVEVRFADLVDALNTSPMKQRARSIDGVKEGTDGYWSRIIELGARAFENYVIHKMQLNGYDNDYLANVVRVDSFNRDSSRFPYLLDEEVAPVAEAFDNLFSEIQTKETDSGNMVMFSRSPMKSTDANANRGEASMNQALLNKADVSRAMYHNELGWIDFVWGDDFKGIKHIIKRRMTSDGMTESEVYRLLTKDLVKTIASGEVIRSSETEKSTRLVIRGDDNEAVLVKSKSGNGWVVTGFKLNEQVNQSRGTTASDLRSTEPIRSRFSEVAVLDELSTMASEYVNADGGPIFKRNDPFFSLGTGSILALEKSKAQFGAKMLNRALVKYFDDTWSDSYESVDVPDTLSQFREEIKVAFGKELRYVRPTDEKFNIFGGVQIPGSPNAIYVNARSNSNLTTIAGHELYHTLERSRPDLHKWFRKQAVQYIQNFGTYRQNLNSKLAKGEKLYKSEVALSELLADFTGDALSDRKFLQELANADGNKFVGLLNVTIKFLNEAITKLKNLGSSQYIKDVEALRNQLKKVLVAFANDTEITDDVVTPQTETPQFKAWFNDSLVTDNGKPMSEGGNPLVVYHGTSSDFNIFKPLKNLIFVSKNPRFASEFASPEDNSSKPNVMPLYVKSEDPFDFENPNDIDDLVDALPPEYSDGRFLTTNNWVYLEDALVVKTIYLLGFDGIYIRESGEKNIAVFSPYQIKSAIGNNGDFDPANPDIRFSRSNAQGRLTPQWQSLPESKLGDNLIYALQDKHIDLKRVSQAIKQAGVDIADRWNTYLQEELFHGRSAKRTQDFIKHDLDPLIQDMRMRGVKMADFEEYLWARHAEERNIQIAKVNPEMQDGGSGMKTQEARDYLAKLSPADKSKYEALARRIDLINKKSRQVLIDYGLESADTIAAWEGAYKNYVPLMREDMDAGFGNGTGQGFSVKGNSSKRATGSNRAVVDIIANMAQQYEKNVIRGEKNRVSTALIGLAKLNPNPDFWEVDTPPSTKTIVKGKTIYEVLYNGSKVNEFTNKPAANNFIQWNGSSGYTINEVESPEQVEYVTDPNYKNRDNVIVARIVNKLGKVEERSVVFNQFDERAMRMAASLKNLDQDQIGELLGAASSITRYFASVNTQYNPIFGLINITRDVQGALLNLSTTPIANKKKEVLGNTLDALKGIYQDLRSERKNGTPSGNKWSQLFEEFQNEGGQTGYRDMFRNAKERGEALKNALDPLWWQNSKIGKVISLNGTIANQEQWVFDKAIKPIFDWLSDYNNALENAVRLSVYKVALDNGHSKQQAASMAKNISVNFNRKGEMGRQIGSLYAFFNASVQGTARIGETLTSTDKNGKIKLSTIGKRIVQGGLLLGSMQALLLAAAGYDDDEPREFVRDRGIIIPLDFFGADGKFVTVPMPLGYNAIPSFSRILTEWALSGGDKTQERLVHILDMVLNVTNPIGNAGLSLQTIAPTVIDPLAALAENKDSTNRPIAREDFNSLNPTPGFTRAKDTASAISKGLAYGINAITGGTDYKPGEFSPSPDQIDYLIGQVTGGVGREAMKVEQTATALVTGEDLPAYKIPIVGRFYGDATGQSSQGNAFYKNLREINKHENQIKGMIKAGEDPTQYRLDNPESRLITQANYTERAVQKLRKQRRALLEIGDNPNAIESIDDRITELMLNLNEKVKLRKEMQ